MGNLELYVRWLRSMSMNQLIAERATRRLTEPAMQFGLKDLCEAEIRRRQERIVKVMIAE